MHAERAFLPQRVGVVRGHTPLVSLKWVGKTRGWAVEIDARGGETMAEISWKITSIMGCGFLRKVSAENEQTPVNARSAGCRSSIDKIIVMKLCDGSGGILAENHSISSHKSSAENFVTSPAKPVNARFFQRKHPQTVRSAQNLGGCDCGLEPAQAIPTPITPPTGARWGAGPQSAPGWVSSFSLV